MLRHPDFNPVALEIGPLSVHWYGLMYLLSFFFCFLALRKRIFYVHFHKWQRKDLDDLLLWLVMGIILGGRLGYVCFYQADYYWQHPLEALKIWQGGMSFHGGLLGVILASWLYTFWEKRHTFLSVVDLVAPVVPIGLGLGRLGNFINGELWGRVSTLPWAMIFPHAPDIQPRHPSQLYELALEGVLLFVILWCYGRKPRSPGRVGSLFLFLYGSMRFLVEFTREPDAFLGLLYAGLSMGQLLSLPMVIIGLLFLSFPALLMQKHEKRPRI